MPTDVRVHAGQVPPKKIVAVLRPSSFSLFGSSNALGQKDIVKINLEMSMEVKFKKTKKHREVHICSFCIGPSSCEGFHGLYIFPVGCKFPHLFQKAGVYTFLFSTVSNSGPPFY